jgi:hypothetical protein
MHVAPNQNFVFVSEITAGRFNLIVITIKTFTVISQRQPLRYSKQFSLSWDLFVPHGFIATFH